MLRIIVRNIVANWVGYAVSIAVGFFLTPFVVHTLGDARYGAWGLLTGLTGYYGLLDLGFRAGLTQFTARYLATKDYEKLNRTASTGVLALGLVGALIALASLILAIIAPRFFHFPPDSVLEVRWSIIIVGTGVAVQFPFFAFSSVLPAAQRYDIANAIGIATRLVSAGLTLLALKLDCGLIGISVAMVASNLLDYAMRWWMAHRIIPQLAISYRKANLASAWEFTHFGIWNVFIADSRRVIQYSDLVILGISMPAAAIAPYVLAVNVVAYLTSLIQPASIVFFPAATQLDARGETETLRRMYLTASRFVLSLAVAGSLLGGFWAAEFFRLWLGDKYVTNNAYGSVAAIYQGLVIAAVVTNGQTIGYQVLLGSRRLKPFAVVFAAEALSNLVLCLVLIPWQGLRGAVLANVIPAVVCQGVFQPLVVCRCLGIPLRKHVVHVYVRPAIFALVAAGAFWEAKQMVPVAQSWSVLIAQGLGAILVLLPAWLLIVPTREDRDRLFLQPLRLATRRLGLSGHYPSEREAESSPQVHDAV